MKKITKHKIEFEPQTKIFIQFYFNFALTSPHVWFKFESKLFLQSVEYWWIESSKVDNINHSILSESQTLNCQPAIM